MARAEERWIVVAQLLRPQGRKGELLAELLTDFPERFAPGTRVYVGDSGPSAEPLSREVTSSWLPQGKNQGRIVLGFEGVTSIGEAEALSGKDVVIPREERWSLTEDAAYISDLAGCTLYDRSVAVGVVSDVDFATTPDGKRQLPDAAPLLTVETPDGGELLIPFVKAWITSLQLDQKRIEMELPEGLVDLNRPEPKRSPVSTEPRAPAR